MQDINFVPEDYVQSSESRRTNLMYIVLFALVMASLGGSFMTIKVRQRAVAAKVLLASTKTAQAKEAIKQFEKLQQTRKAMLKTALTTAELIEPVPRSVLLASLTNNLPSGTSLVQLHVIQKEPPQAKRLAPTNKYKDTKAKKAAEAEKVSPEKLLETYMEIEGVAPSDLEVAAYIENLSKSSLLNNVALVESKEHKIDHRMLRRYKLTAMLKKEALLSLEDIENIREEGKTAVWNF